METMNHKPTSGRKGKKSAFTTVDAMVLLLVLVTVLAAVFGWVYQAMDKDLELDRGTTYVVTFRISETHRSVLDGLGVGDTVYLVEDGSFIGYLRSDLVMQDGPNVKNPDYGATGTGSMICVGDINGRSLELDNSNRCLTPGDTLIVRTERELLTIEVLEITSTSK